MFCTEKEKETCNVEKLGCEGCHYYNDENKIKTSMQQLEIHIANELDDEQWNNWQEVLNYIKKLEENQCTHNISNNCIPKQKIKDKIEELSKVKGDLATYIATSERIKSLQEILED